MSRRGVNLLVGALALVLVGCGTDGTDSGDVESSALVSVPARQGDLLPADFDVEAGDKPVVLWFWAPG